MGGSSVNNFLRCGNNPGKHSFHGKGKPEKKSQTCLRSALMDYTGERLQASSYPHRQFCEISLT